MIYIVRIAQQDTFNDIRRMVQPIFCRASKIEGSCLIVCSSPAVGLCCFTRITAEIRKDCMVQTQSIDQLKGLVLIGTLNHPD